MNLAEFSAAAAEAVAEAGKSVVQVDGRERAAASGIVWSQDGLIVTANHVVERDENVTVAYEGNRLPAQVVGRDNSSDVALLRVEGLGLSAPARLDVADVRVGSFVWAVARPESNLESTLGVVSKLIALRGGDTLLQTDVLMYPGFSGGALVDAAGRLIGMNSSALLRGASGAISVAMLDRVVGLLQEHGRVPRGFLGVSLQPVRLSPAIAQAANQETALMVMSTETDGPAHAAGVTQGDLIIALDGVATRTLEELQRALRDNRAGKQAVLRVVRGGAVMDIPVQIGTR